MFSHGQPVFIGFAPNYRCQAGARHCRLRAGTIIDGPHNGLYIRPPAWRVEVGGDICMVHESLLTPGHDTETETTEQGEVAA